MTALEGTRKFNFVGGISSKRPRVIPPIAGQMSGTCDVALVYLLPISD